MTADPQTTRPGTSRHARSTVRGVRRAMIVLVVGALVVAALLGIAALLGGEFGELQGRIVLSTLVVAAFGTTALCDLAVVTRAVRAIGFCGLAASLGAAVCALVLIWQDSMGADPGEYWWKSLGLLTIAAVALAHGNLLLPLADRPHRAIRAGLAVALAAIAVVAVMLALPVLTDGAVPGPSDDGYWRWFGVAAIVDALGTIALPVLVLVLRGPAGTEPAPASVRLELELPADLVSRLDAAADGGSRSDTAVEVLRRALPAD
ncbi:hypothetical protein [Pseudonocardia sp. HH130630-07]|uniref:hypothetical protein n=1 Tax=Pseudonocardia sp. HH130630-07 TaxID=1690815 RepID=UPI0008150A04|nr:hypothetical protein [Pseudonocardia sp. HH130630-07]ANY09054.1 hypothetical protein AFB00_25485 [Pseudonocardia sp. HH130630-07]